MSEVEAIRQAIAVLEAQRAIIGDDVVELAITPLREKLATLTAQKPTTERQLKYITILFTDIAGSTRLTQGLDPEDIMALQDEALRYLTAVIEEHGGHVTRYMGDGFKAVFGAQVAREDDAERAVRAGLALTEAAQAYAGKVEKDWGRKGFNIRVGINTGPVAIGGFSEAGDTIMGLTVNLAARMESAAPIGGVLISYNTYQHVQHLFEVQPVPPVAAKGFTDPIPAYVVTRIRPRTFLETNRGVQGIEAQLVGRDAELNKLQDIYETVVQSAKTQVVTLIGEPGMGKSRLLYEFERRSRILGQAVRHFRGRATSSMVGVPYSLLRNVFTDYLGILDNEPGPAARQKLQDRLGQFMTDEAEMKTHFIGALLGFDFTDSPHLVGVQGDSKQLRARALFYLEQLITALTDQMPTIILLEDTHWADGPSLDALTYLVRQCRDLRLLIICLARPSLFNSHPEWARAQAAYPAVYTQLDVPPLTPAESRQLVGEILQKLDSLPESLRQLIVSTAEGNPFYVEELIKILIEDGVIQIDHEADVWHVERGRLRNLRVPPTLTALLQARLDNLSPMEKMTIQQAAVVGRVFWDTLLQALQGADRPPERELASLTRRQLIDAREFPAFAQAHEYVFKHALLRDVAYDTVLKRARQTYHARAARWLIEATQASGRAEEYAAVIAEHYTAAGESSSAAEWYIRAGERAKDQDALAEARNFFERALELLPPADRDRRWRALLGHEEVLGILGETEGRLTDDHALLAVARETADDARLAAAYSRFGFCIGFQGDRQQELQAYEEALACARRAGDHKLEAVVLALKVIALTRCGDVEAAASTAEQALIQARELADDFTLCRVLVNVPVFYTETGDIAKAALLMNEAVDINHRRGNRLGEAIGLDNLGYNYLLLGMYAQGREALEQSQRLAETIGARRESAYCLLNLGLAYWRCGDNQAAHQVLTKALPELVAVGDGFGQAAGQSYLALVMEQAGEVGDAAQAFAEAHHQLTALGVRGYAADALVGLARCRYRQARMIEALQHAKTVWHYLSKHGAEGMEFAVRAYQTCAEIFEAAGEFEESRAAIEEGYRRLIQRAEKISNVEWGRSFLENVPEHHLMIDLWERATVLPNSS
jgi:class 3 adenylate cyclase/tetratricopeptide (TPR) repeat protein